jgi:hypothetical protein
MAIRARLFFTSCNWIFFLRSVCRSCVVFWASSRPRLTTIKSPTPPRRPLRSSTSMLFICLLMMLRPSWLRDG